MVNSWIAGVQIPSSLVSTVGSSTMAVMILRSNESLKKPFQRLIFCLSLSDILNSGALMLAPFLTPHNGINAGTQGTCDMQVVIFVVGGFLGVIGYTFGLCLYYLFVVRYNYSDRQFGVTVERILHSAILVMSVVVTSTVLTTKSSNVFPDGTMCYVIDYPFGCHGDPNVDCIRGEHANTIGYYLIIFPVTCVFFGMIATLGTLCWTVYSRERNSRSLLRSSFVGRTDVANRIAQRPSFLTLGERKARKRSRETLLQAVLYISAYTLTYIGPTVCLLGFYYKGRSPPHILSIVVHCLYPMGGVLNILVYTRPKVCTVRKRNTEYSWFEAFWMVVKAGGEVPSIPNFNRRNPNAGHRVLNQSLHRIPRDSSETSRTRESTAIWDSTILTFPNHTHDQSDHRPDEKTDNKRNDNTNRCRRARDLTMWDEILESNGPAQGAGDSTTWDENTETKCPCSCPKDQPYDEEAGVESQHLQAPQLISGKHK